ncbi:MAG TPA: hypothetical protein VIW03_04185 [Anaeromyxobacter sp.]
MGPTGHGFRLPECAERGQLAGQRTDSRGERPARLLTFAPSPGDAARAGALLPDGTVLVLGEEARMRGRALPFDAADVISLIACGEAGLAAIGELLGG